MSRPGLNLLVVMVLLLLAGTSCTTPRHSAPEKSPRPESESAQAAVKAGMDRCPVCGTVWTHSEGQAFVHQGKTYFFCPDTGNRMERGQPTCLEKFKRTPEQFPEKRAP